MNKNNIKYWEERQAQTYKKGERSIKAFHRDLIKAFEQAQSEVEAVIQDFIFRYSKNNNVTFEEAQKQLSKLELRGLRDFMLKSILGGNDLELLNKSLKARMTRYEALQAQLRIIIDNLYKIDYEQEGKERLKDIYDQSYNRTWYNLDTYRGFHSEFAQVNVRDVEVLVNYPFNGANFSDRIWKQKEHLISSLRESITTSLVQGVNPYELSKDFSKKFDTKKYEAYRLLQMETSFIIEQGTLAAYKEDGIEKYKISATLDLKTSEICQHQDGKVYDIKDYVTGKTAPPFHHFCRTTTVPYYGEDEGTRKARDPKTNKTYDVPANMSYKEWYKKYVK